MTLSMYSASVPAFVRGLTNMLAWIDKAEEHAKERGFDPENYLSLRLAPDMVPFPRQIQIASDAVKGCLARLSGTDAPSWEDNEATLDELRARIRQTIEYAESIPAADVDAGASREISLPLPSGSVEFDGAGYLRTVGLPNFYFHCTMTYALLRNAGVQLGKMDFLGAP